jgi:hypothetical protein
MQSLYPSFLYPACSRTKMSSSTFQASASAWNQEPQSFLACISLLESWMQPGSSIWENEYVWMDVCEHLASASMCLYAVACVLSS